jgi:ABC-type uncharacterized transport system permease subunit
VTKQRLLILAPPVAALVLAFVISSIVLAISGANPFEAFGNVWEYGTRMNTLVETINWATPLYLSGVAVAIGFRMNLFNIGVEGQYIVGAFIAAQVGSIIDLPAALHVLVIILTAMAVGAAWAGLSGIMKVTRNVHLGVWDVPDPGLDTALGEIPQSGWFPSLSPLLESVGIVTRSKLWGFVLVAVVVGIAYHYFVNRTRWGYDLRASGANAPAAEASGVDPKRTIVMAMLLSGMIAGLVGLPELLGDSHQYTLRFTQGLGFGGIAVALLGRNHAGGIAIAALLFGWLSRASGVLEVRGDAPREIVEIIQGVIILAVVVAYSIAERYRRAEAAREAAAIVGEER